MPFNAFGAPDDFTAYAVCIYDDAVLAEWLDLPLGQCGGRRPCWSSPGKERGWRFSNYRAPAGGVRWLAMVAGREGKSFIRLAGRRRVSEAPPPPFAGDVVIQLQSDSGFCAESRYSADEIDRNAGARFRAVER